MDFNHKTHNLIILNYNPGSGGKFLSLCLSLHPYCLPMHDIFLRNKMEKTCDEEKNFLISKSVLDLSMKHKTHIEFSHGRDLYGFDHTDDRQSQQVMANKLFSNLTRQDRYFFFLTNHFDHLHNFEHFRNAKHIVIHNDEKILEMRGMTSSRLPTPSISGSFLFDMSTTRDPSLFFDQMSSLCVWLDIVCPSQLRLEDLRSRFIRNLQIPVQKMKSNWNKKGWFKGLAKKS